MKKIITMLLLPLCILTTACSREIGVNQYESSAVGQVNTAREGVVINVRRIRVSTSEGSTGTLAGGIAGGAAGSMIGGNTAVNVIGAVGGAVVGGLVGNAVENKVSEQDAYEYVVRLNSGGALTVTQGTDVVLTVGQKVIVLNSSRGERARIIPY